MSRAAAPFMLRTRSPTSTATTPSTMLESTAWRSLLWAVMVRMRSSSSRAIWLRARPRPPTSWDPGSGRRPLRSPRANRSAPCFISSSGRARRREITRLNPASRRATPRLPQPICISMRCSSRLSTVRGIAVRTTPRTRPSSFTGSAKYINFSPTVRLKRRDVPGSPCRACRISGRLAWFSMRAGSSCESPSTCPEGKNQGHAGAGVFS